MGEKEAKIAPSINSQLHIQHKYECTVREVNWLGPAWPGVTLSVLEHFIGSIFHICIVWNNLCVQALYYNALQK